VNENSSKRNPPPKISVSQRVIELKRQMKSNLLNITESASQKKEMEQ